ncbi:F0F1 ATP synthase subunit B [Kamptonema cortianum]|nr:F0F1 ATP synthase subunit B [Oscillatoria laete-virens]MDK3160328.1 F0F1 ATP synthase subunit B [Kamptonema cortianum]MDL5053712.1 F0F1 ATP synthase subunit B [Oscillatoria laete-virens NRMC-F 0139]
MGDLIHLLGISWPKLIGQIVGFGIVLFVLQKFGFKPVLAMLEARREKIAEGIANAERVKKELAQAQVKSQEILDAAEKQAQKHIEEAREAATRILNEQTQKAIAQAEAIIKQAREASALDTERQRAELKKEIGRLVVETTAQVLSKTLDDNDRKRLNEETIRHLPA